MAKVSEYRDGFAGNLSDLGRREAKREDVEVDQKISASGAMDARRIIEQVGDVEVGEPDNG